MIEGVLALVARAAEAVVRIGATAVEYKGPDDPVTRADREANAILVDGLRALLDAPVVAEESPAGDYAGWRDAETCWFVDPVDGTREFVEGLPQYAVMVGLARGGRSVLGVVHQPAMKRVFLAAEGEGAFEIDAATGARRAIAVSTQPELRAARILASRSRPSPRLAEIVAELGAPPLVHVGSAGVKGTMVAAADADAYVHLERAGYRWDACAIDVIVREAGGRVTDVAGAPLDYRAASLANDGGIVVSNGLLHDEIVRRIAVSDRAPRSAR